MQPTIPVLFLIFNRPEATKLVFNEIKKQKPAKVYIAADGWRINKHNDYELCIKTREIVSKIDWDCEVMTLFRDINLGCKIAVSEAISWFFSNEEFGIILEDDCLPTQSFFDFCAQMLQKYRYDNRIMMISGTNFSQTWKAEKQSYHFSKLGGIWGWACWKRAWDLYDIDMSLWELPEAKEAVKSVYTRKLFRQRKKAFDMVVEGKIDSWAYIWAFTRLINSGLSIVPAKNQIQNIGFNYDATHTRGADLKYSKLKKYEMVKPFQDNKIIVADKQYDQFLSNLLYYNLADYIKSCLNHLIIKLKSL